jgi:hypothetical protein
MLEKRNLDPSMLILGMLMLLCSVPLAAQDNNTTINHATRFAVSPPLRDLAKLPSPPQYGFHEANPVLGIPKRPVGPVVDTVEQSSIAGSGVAYSVGANFLGVGNGFPGYSVHDAPPDTNMAVGDTQIVEWVNVSYTVCQKTSPYTCGPAIESNTLWSSLGGICATNNSDIIAQWDIAAHRWVLAQNVFTGTYGVCIAISTSNDATGTYYLYEFPVVNSGFPDYPKWGIWTVNYGQTWNNFGPGRKGLVGPVFCAYNNAKLLVGDKTAEQICHQYEKTEDSLLPADRDSPTAPPGGQDQFAIGSVGDVDNSHLSLYSVHINNPNDWTQGATFTGDGNSQLVAIAPFTSACKGAYGGDCVPQKGISDLLDSLGDRLMYRFAYYNDTPSLPTPQQHWYANLDVTAAGGQNGVRWMEFATPQTIVTATDLTILQQGTYAPDGNWRWMGSMARDQSNDVLVGYSESNGDMYPSIFVAGRIPTDTLGTLENELALINGTGSQPGTSHRWGDYSAMRIDPVDNCTFWYTTEYYMVTQQFDWSTRIASAAFSDCPTALQFVTVTPCRVVDTRKADGTFGGPPIQGNTYRSFPIPQSACSIPATAAAYSLNVTLVPIQNGPVGYLTIWPTGEDQPYVSTMNSDGRTKANAAIVPAGVSGGVSVYVSNTANVVLDIDGYFVPTSGSTLAFYPLTPCRVLDTRKSNGDLGGPYLQGQQERDFPVLESPCIPANANAVAYSMNFTVVPYNGQSLGYLTVWPTGESQPLVSTLNNPTGTDVANAAIVPAGTGGKIAVYPSNNTNLVVDIDGYFAAAGKGGLSLYPTVPCRVIDTREGKGAFSGTLSPPVDVVDSTCGIPSTATAYVLNATVVPVGSLGYLTLWPDGEGQPYVSTLNAIDGAITSNMAIVPNLDGKTDAYAAGITQLILDISSYFAP